MVTATDVGEFTHEPVASSFNSGDGIVEPSVNYGLLSRFYNTGGIDLNSAEACIKFDSSVAKLTDAGSIGATSGKYAYVGSAGAAGFDHTAWKVEYASASYIGDDPLDNDSDGVADLDSASGRYNGDWTSMRSTNCDDPSIVNWSTDVSSIGLNNINIVRVSAVAPSLTTLEARQANSECIR